MFLALGRQARGFGATPRARLMALSAIVGATLALIVLVAVIVMVMQ